MMALLTTIRESHEALQCGTNLAGGGSMLIGKTHR